ncbi:alpha/beta hydrolase [Catellatospora coxensis]
MTRPAHAGPDRMRTADMTDRTLLTSDGVRVDAHHDPGDPGLAIVVAHGFTGSWRREAVRRAAGVFGRSAGVISFDFRGHGRSGGLSTVGDLEIHDVEAAVAWARALGYRRIVTVGFSMGASVVVRHAALHRGVDAVVAVSGPPAGTTGAPRRCGVCTGCWNGGWDGSSAGSRCAPGSRPAAGTRCPSRRTPWPG